MAETSISAMGSNAHHRFTLSVIEVSTSTSKNTSTVDFYFKISPVATSWNWEQWGANISYKVNINGMSYIGSIANYDGYSTVTLTSKTIEVAHDNNGGKTLSFSFSVTDTSGQSYTCGNASASGSLKLTTIPRYLSITSLELTNKTETSIVVNWKTSHPRNSTYYSLDNGTTWIGSATDGETLASDTKSGSFNIINLKANTDYKLKVKIKRTDTELWTTSSEQAFTTHDYPHCTSAPDFTIGNSVKLEFYNPLARSFTWEVRGADNSLIISSTTTGTSYTGMNGTTPVGNLYKSIPSAKNGTYTVKATYGSNVNTKTGGTYSIKGDEVPTINSFDYIDNSSATVAITGDNTKIVQNYSVLLARYNDATANKGAGGISSYKVECNGKSATNTKSGSYSFGTVDSSSSVDLKLTVTDTRGLSASKTVKVAMLAHSAPTASVTLERLNHYEDETYLTVDGSISSVNGKNTMTIKYRYKMSGGSYGTFENIPSGEEYVFSLNKNNVYIFNVVVTDAFGATFDKEYTLDKGTFPLFIDTEKNSLGMNALPKGERVFEVGGSVIENGREFSIPTSSGEKSGWYLALSGSMTGYDSRAFMIAIQQTYFGGAGILYFNLRCNNAASLSISDFHWLTYSSIAANKICLATSGNNYYLYLKTSENYQQYYLKILQEKRLNGANYNLFTINKPALADTVDEPSGRNPTTLASLLGIT